MPESDSQQNSAYLSTFFRRVYDTPHVMLVFKKAVCNHGSKSKRNAVENKVLIERNQRTGIGRLTSGDRFYKATDKKKEVWQYVEY